jgi:hypothetical protein
MRVNYTLPGFLPAEATPAEPARPGDSPFRARFNFVPAARWADWKSLLRLDLSPVNASTIGPPPRPAGLEIQDAAAQRSMWRQMLDRHLDRLEGDRAGTDPAAENDNHAIGRMLTLLVRFQDLEGEVASRHLAEREQ